MGLAVGLLAAGTALSAFGQYQAGEEAAATSRYNQQVKEREAEAAEQQTTITQRKQARAASQKMSQLRAQMGAAGAVSTVGAPLSILGEQAQESELGILESGYTGRQEAGRLRQEGVAIRQAGKSQRRAARIGAGATLLTGYGQTFLG